MPAPIQIHARLAKYNEDDHTFEAVATDETIDKVRERMHYDSSKGHFAEWSNEFAKVTEGKSVGNLRSMHGKNAAGKLTSLICDDDKRAIIVRGVIVDPNDQLKMAAGVYTGVSIGGECVKKWEDDANKGVMWYEARPSEVSLVDNPCNPAARFTMHKADGSDVELPLTGDPEKVAVNALAELLDKGTVAPSELLRIAQERADAASTAAKLERRETLKKALVNPEITMGDLEKLAVEWLPESERNLDAPKTLAALFKAGEFTAEELDAIEKREFTQDERDKAADKGQAMPDGSYPIKTKGDLENAIQAIGRAKNPAAVKRHIKRRAAALGASDLIPEDWGKIEGSLTLEKGLENLGWLARILQDVICLADQCEYEAMMEQDNSPLPMRLDAVADELGQILCEMAEEETQEEAEKATRSADLQKTLEKYGARHSKTDMGRLQNIHDHAVDMGAKCASGDGKSIDSGSLSKALGLSADASESDLAKAMGAVIEKASKWDKLPVRKGPFRTFEKGEDLGHVVSGTKDEVPADVVELVRAAKSGDLTAHMKLVHRGMGDYRTRAEFEKIT